MTRRRSPDMAITSSTNRLASRLQIDLAKITNAQARDLVAAWARAWDEVAGDLEIAIGQLTADADAGTITKAQVLRSGRLRLSLAIINDRLTRLADNAGVRIIGDLAAVIRNAGVAQAAIIGSQLPKSEMEKLVGWDRVDARQIDAIVKRSTEQITSKLWPISTEADSVIRRELVRGLASGSNPRTTARRMVQRAEGGFNGGLSRALTIARTETLDAHRAAAAESHQANADVLAGWIWMTNLSTRTCPACLGMNGTEHPLAEPGPLGHQNCVLPGAIITGPRASASTTRWFDGEVIDLESASGHFLSVTPNHPVLTTHGWIAAGELREGMYVVRSAGAERVSGSDCPDDYQIPALIEDLAETLGCSTAMPPVTMPTATEDFHGDGAGSQIHVVRTDSRLVHEGLTALAQHRRQQKFALGDVSLPRLAGIGGLDLLVAASDPAASRFMGGPSVGQVLLGRALGGVDSILLGQRPDLHTCGLEAVFDRRAGRAVLDREFELGGASQVSVNDLLSWQRALVEQGGASPLGSSLAHLGFGSPKIAIDEDPLESTLARAVPSRDSLASFAGNVIADRVVNVFRRSWAGHVYNLQTATGWYLANGIVTHNCRCTRVPLTKTWADLGIDLDEPDPEPTGSQEWFDSQAEAVQKQILGPGKYAAYKRGDFPMNKWATRRSNDGWRDSYVPAPAPKPR